MAYGETELGDSVSGNDVRLIWLPVGELGGTLRLSSLDGSSTLTASVNRWAAFSAWRFLYAFLAFLVKYILPMIMVASTRYVNGSRFE